MLWCAGILSTGAAERNAGVDERITGVDGKTPVRGKCIGVQEF